MLAGKIALVTGASGGLGIEICRVLAADGARIVAMDSTPELAQAACRQLKASGIEDALPVGADVASAVAVAAAFAQVESALGAIDILVNNAGIREIRSILDLEPADWDRTLSINLSGPFYCAREAALRMRKRGSGGAIVNIASVAGLIGIRNRPAYTASKHGLVGLTKNLAADLAPYGIRVNAVAPGVIRTPMTEAYYGDEHFLQGLRHAVPLHAKGSPRDIANAVLFLCSPLSDFVTGITLPVDGGFTTDKSYASAESASFVGARASED